MPLKEQKMPASTPTPNMNRSANDEKSSEKNFFSPVIIGTYSPNARSRVEPDIPGSTIAETASAPPIKT